jgi:hypothetical protein
VKKPQSKLPKVGDKIRRFNQVLVVLEVGQSEDDRGRMKPAVRAASQADLDLEAKGGYCPIWGKPVKFKADRYWYQTGEYTLI